MKNRIIDAHSHIGIDHFYRFPGKLQEYIDNSKKIGITDSLLMSTPCPIISLNGKQLAPCIWEYENEHFYFYQEEIGAKKIKISSNPYAEANNLLKENLSQAKDIGINFHFVPLVHPRYDTIEYLEQLLQTKPVAIKLHGISAGFSPYDISNEFWEIIQKFDIPLIIHTDYDNTNNNTPIVKLRNLNQPLNWIKVLSEHNIRALLAHGVRLCKESCRLVNESNNFIVGIGPDALISLEKERLYTQQSDYLTTLFSMISIDKLVFDMDYPWNIKNNQIEFDSIERIKKLNLSNDDLNKVLSQNAIRFFNI